MAEFDVKRVTPLEWAGIGAGLFAFIVSFFPWASIDLATIRLGGRRSLSAWNAAFIAWFPVMLLMAAGGHRLRCRTSASRCARLPLIWLSALRCRDLFILLRG